MASLWNQIPNWARVIAVLATAFTSGGVFVVAFGAQRGLPARVDLLEAKYEDVDVVLRYLACRALAEDEGRDPRGCRYVVAGIDDFLEDLRRR